MKELTKRVGLVACMVMLALAGADLTLSTGHAADHNDPPERAGDSAADLADYYAWHDAEGNMTVVLSFAGAQAPTAGQSGTYDDDVLYGIHFSSTGADGTPAYDPTHSTWVRFGQDSAGEWGVQVSGLPGESEPVEGSVESMLSGDAGGMAWVGLADDPFFFDLEGYIDTVTTGDLSFRSLMVDPLLSETRDSLAGTNATVVVLRFPAAAVTSADGVVHTWATTGRIDS